MDPKTYEQVEIPLTVLGDQILYVKEGGSASVLFWDDKALSVDLPPKASFKVKETDPGVKGNSATNIYKQAVLENGLKLKVPLFINIGDNVVVDSRTGEYVERAK
jgi:elongation factor P